MKANDDPRLAQMMLSEERRGVSFWAKVIPRSSSNAIKLGPNGLVIKVKSPPTDGKANDELRRLLADTLGTRLECVSIVSGDKSRRKRVLVSGLTRDEVLMALLKPEPGGESR
jgi:uncharacterized protein (TIGR00251 family)